MNNNIEKLIDKISKNDKMCKKLMMASSLEDAYDVCISVQEGYTIQELEEFLDSIDAPEDLNPENKKEEISLEDISGGVLSNKYPKILACSLALLTTVSSMTHPIVAAAESKGNTSHKTSVYSEKKQSFWSKYKKLIISGGLVGAVILGLFLYSRGQSNNDAAKNKGTDPKNPEIKPEVKEEIKKQIEEGLKKDASKGEKEKIQEEVRRQLAQELKKDGSKAEEEDIDAYSRAKRWIQKSIFPSSNPFKSFTNAISDLSSLAKQIATIGAAQWTVSQLWNQFLDFRKYVDRKINTEELSLDDAFGNLDKLFKEIKGQEKAKKQVKSIVYGILHRKNQAKLMGHKYDRGDVLYFAGPSGVGKTLMAKGLAKYKILTTNADPFYMSASEVDKESSESVVDQLFGNKYYGGYGGYGYDNGGRNVITKPKNLVKYLNDNPDGIVIVDEYDKMWSPALDEVFRTIVDKGTISVKGQTIDCSGITFILTSNESKSSLEGGNQDQTQDKDVDDGTGSRTKIKHDKSFINRLQPVEFENLSSAEYAQIINKEIKKDLVDYWADPNVKGLKVNLDEKCLKDMAVVVEKKNQGARYITKLQSDLFRDISMKVFEVEKDKKDFYRGKKINVEFNPDTEEFTLKDAE